MGSPKNTRRSAGPTLQFGRARLRRPSTLVSMRVPSWVFNVGLVVATQELAVVVKAPSLGTLHLIVDRSRPKKPVLSRALFRSVEGHEVSLIDGFVACTVSSGWCARRSMRFSRGSPRLKSATPFTSQLAEAQSDSRTAGGAAHQTQRHEAELELKRLGESAAAMELDKQASNQNLAHRADHGCQ